MTRQYLILWFSNAHGSRWPHHDVVPCLVFLVNMLWCFFTGGMCHFSCIVTYFIGKWIMAYWKLILSVWHPIRWRPIYQNNLHMLLSLYNVIIDYFHLLHSNILWLHIDHNSITWFSFTYLISILLQSCYETELNWKKLVFSHRRLLTFWLFIHIFGVIMMDAIYLFLKLINLFERISMK